MRRIQLYIEPDVDHLLSAAAARTGTTRSAIVRQALSAWLAGSVAPGHDPLDDLVGSINADSSDDIDAVIYES
ncbi:ribbon-helix-helix domain-containing protein [Candidatus Microthrix parvicella]|uniref:ribbon-helix-helix domain-containing protein n=1 Tax=Candidatus Neomicrothrix parvicella TaxID=41950 RepID=UPI00037D5E3F|nr:ribbon-helix-helix domain-containing protein [Candidatus Microthrix parvicella]